jgi:hypothetical protein
MAERQDDKAGRGLFGLGARRTEAQAAPRGHAATAIGAAGALSLQDLTHLNLRALAGAAALGGAQGAATAQLDVAGLASRPAHFSDVQSGWFAYWVSQLRCAVRPHRKLWEFTVVLQALYEAGVLTRDAKLLGFGVGGEPLPSYLASLGVSVVATDLPEEAERDRVLNPAFVPGEAFDARVEVSNLDMRRLDDATLRGFDGCWSCSVINTLSTADEAFDTLIGAMDVLRPGGVAVHTTDFAFADDVAFCPRGELAFTRSFFERVADGLNGRGHTVSALSFDLGGHPLDGYVDLEPYEVDGAEAWRNLWAEGRGAPHLKLRHVDLLKTSFVLIVRARQ